MPDTNLKIAVVDLNPARAAVVEDGLRAAGFKTDKLDLIS